MSQGELETGVGLVVDQLAATPLVGNGGMQRAGEGGG